jgi:hypothetical protein
MTMTVDLIVRNARVATAADLFHCDLPDAARPRPRQQSWRRWTELGA